LPKSRNLKENNYCENDLNYLAAEQP